MITATVRDGAKLVDDLRELVDIMRRDYRRREQVTGSPMPVLRAAVVIAERPGIASSQLAEVLGLKRSTVSNLLRDMQARGLVHRRHVSSDRRCVRLDLTERGRLIVLNARSAGMGALSKAVARLKADELARLSLAINPLLQALRAEASLVDSSPTADRV